MIFQQYFLRTILDWCKKHPIELPWRGYNPDAYFVLLSETMLQQTQVSRVIEKYEEFLQLFPTIESVAVAEKEQILKVWNGLGYNSRALRLKQTCEMVVKNHNAIIPKTYVELRSLPGIGDYTASAILCFSFRIPIPVIDVNVIRVISRFSTAFETTNQVLSVQSIREMLLPFFPKKEASEFFQAIMDIARLYCKKSSPNCKECPIAKKCQSNGKLQFQKVTKKEEPSYLGEPRRIWRGRILKVLTQTSPISFHQMSDILQISEHSEWFLKVIHLMEKDSILNTYYENSELYLKI